MQEISFSIGAEELVFVPVELVFKDEDVSNIFAQKNNRSLAYTLAHPRYQHLAESIAQFPIDAPLGNVLYELKMTGDERYKRFLNKYGDSTFCQFYITQHLNHKGLYAYFVENQLMYIGKTKKTFKHRINNGYGRITPKNCYIDGQSTNCHLNALINQYRDRVRFYVCPLGDHDEIDRLEVLLIQSLQPVWNIALKRNKG